MSAVPIACTVTSAIGEFLVSMLSTLYPKRNSKEFPLRLFADALLEYGESDADLLAHPRFRGLPAELRARTIAGVIRATHAARAFAQVGDQDLFKTKLHAIRSIDFRYPEKAPRNAFDLLLEVEVAAQGRLGPLGGRLSGTDVLFEDKYGNRLGLECKRPLSPRTVRQNLRRGLEQLADAGIGGCVVISGDLFSTPLIQRAPSTSVAVATKKAIEQAFKGSIEACRSALESQGSVAEGDPDLRARFGAILCCTSLVSVRNDQGAVVANRLGVRPVSSPGIAGSLDVVRWFCDGLVQGHNELSRTQLLREWPH
jgi:hypothetical protein